MAGFTVVDSRPSMATHLSHLMQVNAAKLLGRVETQQLVEHVAKLAPKLIEEVVPKMVSIATFQKVLQLLLEEACTSATCAPSSNAWPSTPAPSRPGRAGRRVRIAPVARHRAADLRPHAELDVIAIEPGLERLWCRPWAARGPRSTPAWPTILTQKRRRVALKQEGMGVPACLLVPDLIRGAMARLVRRAAPRLQVLVAQRIPETHTIRIGPSSKVPRMNIKRFHAPRPARPWPRRAWPLATAP
jgi:flagellar biosynthesis protein FlhA